MLGRANDRPTSATMASVDMCGILMNTRIDQSAIGRYAAALVNGAR